jgi:predicted enzyme related to lactoylglutathione lyase
MDQLFVVTPAVGSLRDRKAAIDLIKAVGGKILHYANPVLSFPGGWVVECPASAGQDLGLLPWS